MQRSALCRSRRELSNEYLLAKIGVDTAENEPLEIFLWETIQYYSIVSLGLKRKLTLGLSARWRRIKSELIQNGGNFGTEHWITEMRGQSCLFDPGVGGGPGMNFGGLVRSTYYDAAFREYIFF